DGIVVRPERVIRGPHVDPEASPVRELGVLDRLLELGARHVEVGRQGHDALPAFSTTLKGTAGPGANSPACGAMRCTASPVMVTISLGDRKVDLGLYSNCACTDQKSPMMKKLKVWGATSRSTLPAAPKPASNARLNCHGLSANRPVGSGLGEGGRKPLSMKG